MTLSAFLCASTSTEARTAVVEFRGITALLTVLERYRSDVALSLSVRETLHSLVMLFPAGLLGFLTEEQGLVQIHRMAKSAEMQSFHAFLALLLWIAAVELPSLQAALAEPDGLGMWHSLASIVWDRRLGLTDQNDARRNHLCQCKVTHILGLSTPCRSVGYCYIYVTVGIF